jgi:hypothetical protein
VLGGPRLVGPLLHLGEVLLLPDVYRDGVDLCAELLGEPLNGYCRV